jgi:hypothetical protein
LQNPIFGTHRCSREAEAGHLFWSRKTSHLPDQPSYCCFTKPSRLYHVALQDWYVRGNWDRINALCAYNGISFDPTGQRINRHWHWCVYEFTRQVDAIMFWDKFGGRWMRHNDFFYPYRPEDMPEMKVLPFFEKLCKKNGR